MCRVYDTNGITPTQHTCGGGNLETKIVERNRFYEQAFETAQENDCDYGDTIDAFNKKVNKSGVSPTVTTRPDGFKTAILAVDGFNQSIRADQTCFGTITRNAGADLKRNGQGVIEIVSRPHGNNKGGVVKSDIFPTVRKAATMDGNTGIVQPVIGAFRGRNPVQKDNVVLEPSMKQTRIRKLTPKECGRLMGVRDDDIDTMSVNQSNSSLYHCFGDSIVVDVLMAIFKQMI